VSDANQLISCDDTVLRPRVETVRIVFAAAARVAIIWALPVGDGKEIEDIPAAADAEEDEAIDRLSNETGAGSYFTALGIAAALLFVWAGLCTI
jgi:hypothetical protein